MKCMHKRIAVVFFFLCLVFGSSGQLPTHSKPEFKGYLKNLQEFSFARQVETLQNSGLMHNRINFKWREKHDVTLRLEARTRIFYGDQLKLFPGFNELIARDPGYLDLTSEWVDKSTLVAVTVLDRAQLNYFNKYFSVTVGRQRINWGINNIWNTNDLFNAYDFLDYDYEERPGSDAFRLQFYKGLSTTFEIAAVPARSGRGIVAGRIRTNKWNYDFQLIGGMYKNDLAIGGGWAGNIKDAGFKGEVTYFKDVAGQDRVSTITGSVMFDYSFKNSWYVSTSILYVQEPLPVLLGLSSIAAGTLDVKSLMPYRWSYYAGFTKTFTPLLTASFALIYSPTYRSTIIFPSINYNIAQNFDLTLTSQSFFSDRFGVYRAEANAIILRLSWNF